MDSKGKRTRHEIDVVVFNKIKPLLNKGVSYKDITSLTGISRSTLDRMKKVTTFSDYHKMIVAANNPLLLSKEKKDSEENIDNNLFLMITDIRKKVDNLSSRFTNLIEVITASQLSGDVSSLLIIGEVVEVLEDVVEDAKTSDLSKELWDKISTILTKANKVLNKEND